MKKILILCWLLLICSVTMAQTGYNCANAIHLTDLSAFCSANAAYANDEPQQNGVTWFSFTAARTAVNVTIGGAGTNGSLESPSVKLYDDCNTQNTTALTSTTGNITTLHAQNLNTGQTYYLAVSGQNKGNFKLCINNYNIAPTDGEDCETALYLENTNDVYVPKFIGAGLKGHETFGTCLDGDESNSTWYKWKAANNGKLVFTIIPDQNNNDIDFVLYDLDTSGNCGNVTFNNAIRCAAGHGIGCRTSPNYSKTGLDFNANDYSEPPGCDANQDGLVRFVNMVQGHTYGLIINNYSGNQGFKLTFADRNGVPGDARFDLPDAIVSSNLVSCVNKSYTFNSYSTQNNIFKWDFGEDATIIDADASGNFTVSFATSGVKTIKLIIYNSLGQSHTTTTTLTVPNLTIPAEPAIIPSKSFYCTGETLHLSTPSLPGLTYLWTGPNGFTSTATSIDIPVTDNYINGSTYKLATMNGPCISPIASITPVVSINPVAAFDASPPFPATLKVPVTVNFTNNSTGADHYTWDFGDGSFTTDINPQHIYSTGGVFHVKLTAFNTIGCTASVTEGDYTIRYGNTIFIPNAFTPNADGINDNFKITLTNIRTFHLQIFNRWGQVVFESRSPIVTWDGTYNGNNAATGTYYYLIDARGLDDNTIKQSGYLSLIR